MNSWEVDTNHQISSNQDILNMNGAERKILLQFCERWKKKVKQEPLDNNLEHYFDHFVASYIIYNAIYSKITNGNGDRDMAVKGIKKYLIKNNIIDKITTCEQVATILKAFDKFHFCNRPNPKTKNDDEHLKLKLQSAEQKERIHGILWLIYEVRCNLFHGEKGYEEKQKALLRPLCEILDSVDDALIQAINSCSPCG